MDGILPPWYYNFGFLAAAKSVMYQYQETLIENIPCKGSSKKSQWKCSVHQPSCLGGVYHP